MRVWLPFVLLLAWLALVVGGCDDDGPCELPDGGDADADGDADGDGGDADADQDRECIVPEVECDESTHPEYGLCVPNTDEIAISGATFDMGAPSGTEFPLHSITLSDFTIDRTEVTVERYQACVASGCCSEPSYDGSYSGRQPYYGNADFARYPVIFVSWNQAREYCEGLGKRLPTEAEWEFAARGTDGRMYPWGTDAPTRSRVNYDRPRDGDTNEVGSHPSGASAFGLEDMAGNVWEWVGDWYSSSYYGESPSNDPQGPESGVTRSARGGSFGSAATEIYAFYRSSFLPIDSFSNLGFRCAR